MIRYQIHKLFKIIYFCFFMDVVILCGGKGIRLSEYTEFVPKPLIEIGGKPILLHIMNLYAYYGFKDFIICLGYKGDMIRQYFIDNKNSGWNINLVDTGEDSTKAERLLKVKKYIKNEDFFLTYGDDLSDVDIKKLYNFHKSNNRIVTLTAVKPESNYGILNLQGNSVTSFIEKPKMKEWINGGYFVINKKIFEYMKPKLELEKEVFKELVKKGEIGAFKYEGFWKSMNTLKDVNEFNDLYNNNKKPWIKWKE